MPLLDAVTNFADLQFRDHSRVELLLRVVDQEQTGAFAIDGVTNAIGHDLEDASQIVLGRQLQSHVQQPRQRGHARIVGGGERMRGGTFLKFDRHVSAFLRKMPVTSEVYRIGSTTPNRDRDRGVG